MVDNNAVPHRQLVPLVAPTALTVLGKTLADNLTLELGERKQHVERQAPHAAGGVERLGHRHEARASGVEHFDDLCEISQAPGQPIHLIDDDYIDLAQSDVWTASASIPGLATVVS